MVDAVHLRTVLTNTNLIDRVQQTQQEQQDQNLRHAIQEDLREFANKKDAVNLTTRMENKIIVKDETRKRGSKGEGGKKEKEEEMEKAETVDETGEGSIIDIHV